MVSLLIPVLLGALGAPNVVFVSVDTLRADHLGVYGAEFNATPNLDRLANNALLFEDVICEQPQTGPSLAAMHSSQVPRAIGTIYNGITLPPDTTTVAMIFQEAGYETAAIVSNAVLSENSSGLGRGFSHYDSELSSGPVHRRGEPLYKCTADRVTDRALAWLEQWDGEKPLFFWVHYMDPHGPYIYRPGFDEQLPNDVGPGGRDGASKRAYYRTEVALADQQIQRLIDALPKEDTYILFTSDHGEALGEHGVWGHTRYIHQTTMHIPLIIHGPEIGPGRIDRPARGIDIGPTLLGLAGLAPGASMKGMDLRQTLPEANVPRCFESYEYIGHRERRRRRRKKEDVQKSLARIPPYYQGIIQEGWKLIHFGKERYELFNLAVDPREENDIASEHLERVETLRAQLTEWNGTTRLKGSVGDLTEDDLRRMEALGYL